MGNQKHKAAQFFGLIIALASSIILPNLRSTILKQNKQAHVARHREKYLQPEQESLLLCEENTLQ